MESNRTEEITIRVDRKLARAYKAGSPEKQQKIETLMNSWLREAEEDNATLDEIVHLASEEAKAKGLTPEVLEQILNDRSCSFCCRYPSPDKRSPL